MSQPGRAATPSADSPQHLASARKISVGISLDDVLGVELRVVVALLGTVGDVGQPEQGVHLAGEGVAGEAVQGRVELVVVSQRFRGRRILSHRGHGGLDVDPHLPHQLGRLTHMAGGGAELLELGVDVVDGDGRRPHPHVDAQRHELILDLAVAHHHQVRVEGRDSLDVGLEPRQIVGSVEGLGREVRVLVDSHHLVAGTYGEQHLGASRRQADDGQLRCHSVRCHSVRCHCLGRHSVG